MRHLKLKQGVCGMATHTRNSPMFISLLMKNGLYFGAV